MPKFFYRGINPEKQMMEGFVEGVNEEMAADILIDRGFVILELREKGKGLAGRFTSGFVQHIPLKNVVILSRQLSILISANIPLVQSLKILLKQTGHKKLVMVVGDLVNDVEGGMKFSTALAKHPNAFDDFYVNLVKSGETSGKLDEVLLYLADQMEKDYDLISRIRGAMVYPIFIITGLFIVGSLMMIFVIPKITSILTEAGAELPISTQILIGTSSFLQKFWWVVLLGMFGSFVGLRVFIRTPAGRYTWDLVKLRIPLFGNLFQKIAVVRFSRSMYTLVVGGVTLPRAFKIVSDVVGNQVYRRILIDTVKEVEGGNPIATVFSKSPHIPFMVSQMLNVGEKTGRLDLILEKITAFYTREIDNLLRNLITLIEPIVMVIIGVAVGLMIAAIILPLYNLASAI